MCRWGPSATRVNNNLSACTVFVAAAVSVEIERRRRKATESA